MEGGHESWGEWGVPKGAKVASSITKKGRESD